MELSLLMVCCLLASITGIDRVKLARTPRPLPKFDVERYVGDWYFLYRLPPCSWNGSNKFSNFVSQYTLMSDGTLSLQTTYRPPSTIFIYSRSSVCTSIQDILKPHGEPGVYTLKDPIGDVMSGTSIIVATDYKNFVIKWGCTKEGNDGNCDDPYVNIKSRHRDPDPYTLRTIQAIIDKLFSLSLDEMVKYSQNEPCIKFAEKSVRSRRYHGYTLDKKY